MKRENAGALLSKNLKQTDLENAKAEIDRLNSIIEEKDHKMWKQTIDIEKLTKENEAMTHFISSILHIDYDEVLKQQRIRDYIQSKNENDGYNF